MQQMADARASTAQLQALAALADASPRLGAQHKLAQLMNRGRADNAGVIQAKTEIKHTPGIVKIDIADKKETFMVGKEMDATLDPEDPVQGSATGTNWTWMKTLRGMRDDANVVRGHLLNHDLGGYSVPENLYPISTKANTQHSEEVEQEVKNMLYGKNEDDKSVSYSVNVEDDNNNPDSATFVCEFGYVGEEQIVKRIPSDLNLDSGGFGGGKRKIIPPGPWYHGKRKDEVGGEWADQNKDTGHIEAVKDKIDDFDELREKSTVKVQGGGGKSVDYYLQLLGEGYFDELIDEEKLEETQRQLNELIDKRTELRKAKVPDEDALQEVNYGIEDLMIEVKEWAGEVKDGAIQDDEFSETGSLEEDELLDDGNAKKRKSVFKKGGRGKKKK